MVGWQVDEEKTPSRMDSIDQFPELVERRCEFVKLRHRRIDAEEVKSRERTAVFAHNRICRRHRERRQRLNDAKAHFVHYEVEPPCHLAKRPELAGENRIDGVGLANLGALDLYVGVGAVRPFWHGRPLWKEARLAGEYAHLVKQYVRTEQPGLDLLERDVSPSLRQRRLTALCLGDDFAAPYARMPYVCSEGSTPLSGTVKTQRNVQHVAAPLEQEISRLRRLCHFIQVMWLWSSIVMMSCSTSARTVVSGSTTANCDDSVFVSLFTDLGAMLRTRLN